MTLKNGNKKYPIYISKLRYHTKKEYNQFAGHIYKSLTYEYLTLEDIANNINIGYTIQCANPKEWKGQQIFGIDIDSAQLIDIECLLKKLKGADINPFVVYATLSNIDIESPTHIRLLFVVNELIQSQAYAENIIHMLLDITKLYVDGVDFHCCDTGRMFFPGEVIYLNSDNSINISKFKDILLTLYQNGTMFLIDRNKILRNFRNHIRANPSLSGVQFNRIPHAAEYFLCSFTESQSENIFQIIPLQIPSHSQNIQELYKSRLQDIITNNTHSYIQSHKTTLDVNSIVESISSSFFINRYYIYLLGGTNAFCGQLPKPASILVPSHLEALVLKMLCNFFFSQCKFLDFDYENFSVKINNLNAFRYYFGIQKKDVKIKDVKKNLIEFQNILQSDIFSAYTFLQKKINNSAKRILTQLIQQIYYNLSNVEENVVCTKSTQYIISIAKLVEASQINNKRQIKTYIQLFDQLNLIRIVDKEQYNKNINFPVNQQHYVIEVPFFDKHLLQTANNCAQQLLKKKQNVTVCVDQSLDSYTDFLRCVTSLLNSFGYVTRSMVIQSLRDNEICETKASAEWMFRQHMPVTQKRLKLEKKNYSYAIKQQLAYCSKDLTYGSSILYMQKEVDNGNHNKCS